jgi:hypothetical protein
LIDPALGAGQLFASSFDPLHKRSADDETLSVATPDSNLVEQLYAQCASISDWLCGPILQAGLREAMHQPALRPGNEILEIGIGTGLTAPLYPDDCRE